MSAEVALQEAARAHGPAIFLPWEPCVQAIDCPCESFRPDVPSPTGGKEKTMSVNTATKDAGATATSPTASPPPASSDEPPRGFRAVKEAVGLAVDLLLAIGLVLIGAALIDLVGHIVP